MSTRAASVQRNVRFTPEESDAVDAYLATAGGKWQGFVHGLVMARVLGDDQAQAPAAPARPAAKKAAPLERARPVTETGGVTRPPGGWSGGPSVRPFTSAPKPEPKQPKSFR